MKPTTIALQLAAVLVTAVACAPLSSTEEAVHKNFAVQPGGTVTVDVDFGAVEVTAGGDNEVVVDAWRKISRANKAAAQAFLRDHPLSIVQDGSNLTIRSKHSSRIFRGWRNRNEGNYTISVPGRFNARLRTAGGGIAVSGLTGEVYANTSGGVLKFAHLKGPLKGGTSGGGIDVDQCEGNLRVNTSGGPIQVTGGSGSLEGHTSGGTVAVREFLGPANVETSGGGVQIERVAGEISGSSSGGSIKAQLLSPVEAPVRLTTSGGSVTVLISQRAAFDLDAQTSGESVSSELPVAVVGKLDRHRLKGTVNGGGKVIFLRTSGGSIRVKKL